MLKNNFPWHFRSKGRSCATLINGQGAQAHGQPYHRLRSHRKLSPGIESSQKGRSTLWDNAATCQRPLPHSSSESPCPLEGGTHLGADRPEEPPDVGRVAAQGVHAVGDQHVAGLPVTLDDVVEVSAGRQHGRLSQHLPDDAHEQAWNAHPPDLFQPCRKNSGSEG